MSTQLNYENLDDTVRADLLNFSPTVTDITYPGSATRVSLTGGDTITVTGTNFASGAQVYLGVKAAQSVTFVSSTQLTVVVPSNLAGTLPLVVVNSGGGFAKHATGIVYEQGPVWNTLAGALGTVYTGATPSWTLSATSNSAISYAVASGSLPAGVTLDSASGTFVGASPTVASPTTYTFTVTATDAENQVATRTFSMIVATDAIYWASPVQSASYTYTAAGAIVPIMVSAYSYSGNAITVSVTNLPAGLSYVASSEAGGSLGSIKGVPGVNGTYSSVTLTATITSSGLQSSITLSITVNKTSGQIIYSVGGTYQWVCPTGVTSVSVLCVGAGGGCGSSWGGGGGGGALTYGNNIAVVAGNTYNLQVGSGGGSDTAGTASWFNTAAYLNANGGAKGVTGNGNTGGGGGGAGGYAGVGGAGAAVTTVNYAGGAGGTSTGTARTSGFAGGAGGGGKSTNVAGLVAAVPTTTFGSGAGGGSAYGQTYGGGGVGLNGQISQSGNPTPWPAAASSDAYFSPNGGSWRMDVTGGQDSTGYGGGWPGGGGSGVGGGADGAVRIMWPAASRSYPSTNTLDL